MAECFTDLTTDNQADIAERFVAEGELAILKENLSEGIQAFEAAEALDPLNASLYHRMGLSLFEYGSEEGRARTLLMANKKFKYATSLNPAYFEAFHAWGNALVFLGETFEEHHYFLEAKARLEQALSHVQKMPDNIQAELHWDYGVVWYHIGNHSKEAIDYQYALRAFEKAALLCGGLPIEFWIDYGTAALLISDMVSDTRHIVKAVHCFKHALSLNKDHYDAWASLAESLEHLYLHTHDEDHFNQAIEYYNSASKLAPQDGDLWLSFAQLLLNAARHSQDIKRLRACLEKCHHAYACLPDEPIVLATWAEALALLGQNAERLDLLHEAENKIAQALEMDEEESPELWHAYGMCLTSFGAYFNDFDYYYQAIEKFQEAISIDRTFAPAWHAIATTYISVGLIEGDTETLIKSLKFFEKALALDNSSYVNIDYAMALAKIGEATHSEQWLDQAAYQFERTLNLQKNALYLHPNWLFHYACVLDLLGDFHEEESYYTRTIEIFTHVLMVDPDYPEVHHRMAQAFCHLGELIGEVDYFHRAIHHLRLALKHEDENDHMILDWGLALINIAERASSPHEIDQIYLEAEHKMTLAAKLGNIQAYYHLSCLYSLTSQYEKALQFLIKADTFKALPPIDEMMEDEWLEGLRATTHFQYFLSQIENRPNIS